MTHPAACNEGKKDSKRWLTRGEKSDILDRRSGSGGGQQPGSERGAKVWTREKESGRRKRAAKKTLKKVKKLLEKYLTNGKLCGILEKLSQRDSGFGP